MKLVALLLSWLFTRTTSGRTWFFSQVCRCSTRANRTTCFWKPRRASVRMLCSCTRTGTQPFSRIPLRMEEVARKLYLSETPSIGWEAKTLGAKRRISSSEIATVPGAAVSAVLMLVDLVSWFCEPQQKGEALGAAGVFSTFGFGRKRMLGIFFEPKAKR